MQTFAASLDIAFLASPTSVEAFVALFGRKSAEFCEFTLREETAGDVFPVFDGTDQFDVNAESSIWCEGEQCQTARVRDVEVGGRVGRTSGDCEHGFAALGVFKLELLGWLFKILAEQLAESGAGGDVGIAVAVECEAVGAGELVGRKAVLPSDSRQALRVVGQAPHMDFARGQAEGPGRMPPFLLGRGCHGGILC